MYMNNVKFKQKQIKKIMVSSSGKLKRVLVCSPENFVIIKPINYTEKETFKEGIKLKKLLSEHKEFCTLLKNMGIMPVYLPLIKDCPQQTFSRDIAFVIKDCIYLACSTVEMRKKETDALKALLTEYPKVYEFENNIEGGDVIVYNKYIFLGISDRTDKKAITELQEILPKGYRIVPVRLRKKILHLDTVLNYVGDIAVFYKQGIKGGFKIEKYFKKVIYTTKKQQKHLPTNFLALSPIKIIASRKNREINAELEKNGIEVIEGSFNEMLKLGGSYRCCSQEIIKN